MRFKIDVKILLLILLILATPVLVIVFQKKNNSQIDEFAVNQKKLGEMVNKIGVEKTYAYFKKNFFSYEPASRHYLGHFLGQRAYETRGDAGFNVCDYDLDYGCIHGFVIAGINVKGKGYVDTVMNQCKSIPNNQTKKESCIHGVSHTILSLKGYKLEDLKWALNRCDEVLSDDVPAQCYSAVFMEYNLRSLDGQSTTDWFTIRQFDQTKPTEPCGLLDLKYQQSCFSELGSYWSNVFGSDYSKMAGYCDSAKVLSSRKSCYWGVARSMADLYNYDVKKIGEECGRISSKEMHYSCIYGAAVVTFNNQAPNAVKICDYLEGSDKSSCLSLYKVMTSGGSN